MQIEIMRAGWRGPKVIGNTITIACSKSRVWAVPAGTRYRLPVNDVFALEALSGHRQPCPHNGEPAAYGWLPEWRYHDKASHDDDGRTIFTCDACGFCSVESGSAFFGGSMSHPDDQTIVVAERQRVTVATSLGFDRGRREMVFSSELGTLVVLVPSWWRGTIRSQYLSRHLGKLRVLGQLWLRDRQVVFLHRAASSQLTPL